MKVNVVSSVLAGIGLLALSTAVAQAGGGPGGGATLSFMECYEIEGVDQHRTVDILGSEFGEQDNVRVHKGRLVCTPVTVDEGGIQLTSDPSADHLKCYKIDVSGPQEPHKTETTLSDPFVSSEIVRVHNSRYLCLPATSP